MTSLVGEKTYIIRDKDVSQVDQKVEKLIGSDVDLYYDVIGR